MPAILLTLADDIFDILYNERKRQKRIKGNDVNYEALIERLIINSLLSQYYLRSDDIPLLLNFLKNNADNYDPAVLENFRDLLIKLRKRG